MYGNANVRARYHEIRQTQETKSCPKHICYRVLGSDCHLRFNLDERICDGFYYASLIKYFLRLLSHPEVLDRPPETIEQDIP